MEIASWKEIDINLLREVLSYDPCSGKLTWKYRPQNMFPTHKAYRTWNVKNSGKEAFTSTAVNGYKQGRIFSNAYTAHRVAWALHHGDWPKDQVDHINGIKTDNRMENLRLAKNRENARNRGKQSNNTSGYKGVSYYRSRDKWEANICVNGISKRLGYFATAEEARDAYNDACKILHGDFANTD